MSPEDLGRLPQFFGGYFNEDWDLDGPDADAILDRFMNHNPDVKARSELAALIDRFLNGNDDDAQLAQRLFKQLWCYYAPAGSTREWLQHVARRLRARRDSPTE